MDKLLLKNIIVNHKKNFLSPKKLIKRDILSEADKYINSKEIVFITGIRRSGKSSLMALFAKHLLEKKKINGNNILFINFEDERFINFNVSDFDSLFQTFIELENPEGKKYLFFDEIQNITGWERWLNRIYEFENVKIFITGSNASIIGSSVSSSLTGRNRQIRNYNFSFNEYLLANDFILREKDELVAHRLANIKREFNNYILLGGFPEIVTNKDIELADQYYKDIIHRDIVSKYSVRNISEVRELCLYLISNSGCLVSYESLKKTIQAKNTTTIKNYINIFRDVFLINSLPLFDYSIKRQIYNPEKYYVSDLSFYHAIGYKFSDNLGKLLENIVFEQLLRLNPEIYYWKTSKGKEVDFLIRKGKSVTDVYQVTYKVSNENKQREISGLETAAAEFGNLNRFILTNDQEYSIKDKYGEILVIPVWKWLLGLK